MSFNFGLGDINGSIVTPTTLYTGDAAAIDSFGLSGMYSYTSPNTFDWAMLFISPEAGMFTVDNISYQPAAAPVPVPPAFALLAPGLLVIAGRRFLGRKN